MTKENSKWISIRWFLLRIILLAFDIIAVNAAIYIALYTRFYVASQIHPTATVFFARFRQYAPYYTLFCLIVFGANKLYTGIWRYAGFHDLNRILLSNLITFLGHVAGTMVFQLRMPLSVYAISGIIQLIFIGVSRFSYRLLLTEKQQFFDKNKTNVNALVVGTGGTARNVIKQLTQESVIRPVCILDYTAAGIGSLLNGVPVVNGTDNLQDAIDKYHVNMVILASTMLSKERRSKIMELCKAKNVEVQDYAGFFQLSGEVILKNIMQCISGPVEIVANGHHQKYDSCEDALMSVGSSYVVKKLTAKKDVLVIELSDHDVVLNDLNEDWVKQQKTETGEDISFF